MKILKDDQLSQARESIQKDWKQQRFYSWLKEMFRPKTTFEKYILLIIVLQLITIGCSFISYCTGRVWMEQYIQVWMDNTQVVFYTSVFLLVLLEAVKVLAAMPIFLSLVRSQPFSKFALVMVFLTFGFSAYISYHGGAKEVLDNSKPTLIKVDSIQSYYDTQLATLQLEKDRYLNDKAHRNSKGIIFIKTMRDHVEPLSKEIQRITKLRDDKVGKADQDNAGIESLSYSFVTADAEMMGRIAIGSDLIKLIISFITSWFFVACAVDFELIHQDSKREEIEEDKPTISKGDKRQEDKQEETVIQAVQKQEDNLGDNVINNMVSNLLGSESRQSEDKGTNSFEWSVSNGSGAPVETVVVDKHTINHKGKRYTKRDVKSFIRKYQSRVQEAKESSNAKLASSRQERLDYWNSRMIEFPN